MSADQNDGLPLRVDVGLKPEVKAEIPPEATGRLLDALTDAIRPFTEARGLRADQIRLRRAEVAPEIARKGREIAALTNGELHPVPTKLLVPFLEKASLEDADEDLRDRWAALLVSASKEYHARHLSFVDILSRLSSDEIMLVEEVCFSCASFPLTFQPTSHLERNEQIVVLNREMLRSPENTHQAMKASYANFASAIRSIDQNY
jgi:abortive infection alpha-like protein